MKNKIIKIFSSIFIINSVFTSSVYASNYDNSKLSNYNNNESINLNGHYFDIITENNLMRGAKPPTGSSFVDLNNTSYGYKVEELQVNVYSNTFFKGTKYINVTVNNVNVNKNGMSNPSSPITVYLYKKGGIGAVDSEKVGLNGGTVKFDGLDKDEFYYIGFSKATDTQIYSFDGMVY